MVAVSLTISMVLSYILIGVSIICKTHCYAAREFSAEM